MRSNSHPQNNSDRDPAPFFGSWRKAYCAALAVFAFEILLFYVFTVVFA